MTTLTALAAPDRGTPRAQVRKYAAIARINIQNSLAYTWDAFGQGIFITLFIFIFAQLWKTTFAAQNVPKGGTIGGLTLVQTLWYFVWAELIQLSKLQVAHSIERQLTAEYGDFIHVAPEEFFQRCGSEVAAYFGAGAEHQRFEVAGTARRRAETAGVSILCHQVAIYIELHTS